MNAGIDTPLLIMAVALAGSSPAVALAASTSTAPPSWLEQIDRAAAPAPQAAPSDRGGVQSLNPDVSAILDVTGGYGARAPARRAGDDPDLGGGPQAHAGGFTVQEAEVAIQSIVDPFFRADLFLTIPNLAGLEVEEAFVTTTALPGDLQIKAGTFRSALGRNNGQHLHLQDFTRRPLITAAYLGEDGLRAPGAQVSWLVPLPFYLQLTAEALSVAAPDERTQLSTFGGGSRREPTGTAVLRLFVPATDDVSIYLGLNAGLGRTAGRSVDVGMGAAPRWQDARTQLYGTDLYLKWKPLNQASTYFSVAWTTEYFLRRLSTDLDPIVDGGLYSQLVVQLARSWFVGVREDVLGAPVSSVQPRSTRTSGSVTYVPSEFARLRAYVEQEWGALPGTTLSPQSATTAYLQLEVAIGAHGAHPF